jgi:hypothetical protein
LFFGDTTTLFGFPVFSGVDPGWAEGAIEGGEEVEGGDVVHGLFVQGAAEKKQFRA